ncbi:hypothetical protein D3C72_1971550 [compost metagenome]
MLHEAGYKLAVCFVILNAIIPGAITATDFFIQRVPIFTQNLFNNLRNGFVLEYLEIAFSGGQPQPGAQPRAVRIHAVVLPLHAKPGDDAVDVARATPFRLYDDRGVFAQQRLGVHAFALAEQVHIQSE